MKLIAKLAAATTALALCATPVQASPITYPFPGPKFDVFTGPTFTTNDKITGAVTLDSDLFSNTGDAALYSERATGWINSRPLRRRSAASALRSR